MCGTGITRAFPMRADRGADQILCDDRRHNRDQPPGVDQYRAARESRSSPADPAGHGRVRAVRAGSASGCCRSRADGARPRRAYRQQGGIAGLHRTVACRVCAGDGAVYDYAEALLPGSRDIDGECSARPVFCVGESPPFRASRWRGSRAFGAQPHPFVCIRKRRRRCRRQAPP